jgi:hypothetical protein
VILAKVAGGRLLNGFWFQDSKDYAQNVSRLRFPGLVPALKRLVEPATLGDPMR